MEEIINNVFSATVENYEKILSRYYPSHRSNGLTERNLTFNFSHNYLLKNREAIIWQECPLKDGNHFDTLIIDDEKNTIIIVEAKRLQNEGKFELIKRDISKINIQFNDIKLDDKRLTYKRYGLILFDIWISKKRETIDIRYQLLQKLLIEKPDEQQKSMLVNIDYSDNYKEKYHLAYKLFQLDKVNIKTI